MSEAITSPDGFFTKLGGEFFLSTGALALMFGVSERQVLDRLDTHSKPTAGSQFSTQFPHLWIQNGRRRVREAFAAIGSDDMASALAYLERLGGAA